MKPPKIISLLGVAADGSERQGSQFLICGSLYKLFGRGLGVFFYAVGWPFYDIFLLELGLFFSNRRLMAPNLIFFSSYAVEGTFWP